MLPKLASFFVGAASSRVSSGPPHKLRNAGPGLPPGGRVYGSPGRTFDNGTSIVEATLVTSGILKISDTVTIADLPSFCRVQGVSKPSADSDIRFEVWLPQPALESQIPVDGRRRLRRTVELSAQRHGRRDGRAPAAGIRDRVHRHRPSGLGAIVGVGHPEKAADYLYRAKHVTTVAAKAIVAAYYGDAPAHSYFNSCSNGGRQGLIEAQRYPDDFDGLIIGAPWNFQSHSNAGFIWDAQTFRAGRGDSLGETPGDCRGRGCRVRQERRPGRRPDRDPQTCKFDPKSLVCHGADGNGCLTTPQVAALEKIYDGPKNPRTGESIFPGFARGSEAGWTGMVRPTTAGSGLLVYFSTSSTRNPSGI